MLVSCRIVRFTFYMYNRGRSVHIVGRTCGPTPLSVNRAIKYVQIYIDK